MMARKKARDIRELASAVMSTPVVETAFPSSDIVDLPVTADRVGNVSQKERAAYEGGLTRAKVVAAIKELLEAVVVETVYDEMGRASTVEKPDKVMRAKGAELAGKYFGDYKERDTAVTVQHNKIVVQWMPSPARELT